MELEQLLTSYNGSEESYQALAFELKKVLIESILDEVRLQDIYCGSYIHQLGFEKYTLLNSVSGKTIRLHFWSKKNVFKDDVHSHCASFKSVILNGYTKQNTFELINGSHLKKYSYTFDEHTNSHTVFSLGLVDSTLKNTSIFSKKDFYIQNFKELHQVFETDKNTLTISMWDKREYPALVLKELSSEAHDCTYTTKLSKKLIVERFQLFLELLK